MQFSSNISAEIKQRIEAAISGAHVEIAHGSARHYELYVISATFEGLSQVKQQQDQGQVPNYEFLAFRTITPTELGCNLKCSPISL